MARPADRGVSPLRKLWLPWVAAQVVQSVWGDIPAPTPQVTFADVLRAANLYDKRSKNGPESPA
jgi:hypothetical protein